MEVRVQCRHFSLGESLGKNHSCPMSDLVRVEPIALLPTQSACAVFLGDGKRSIVFFIDPAVGISINAILGGEVSSRPQTHDLFAQTLEAFGARMSRAVIVKVEDDVYYARLIIEARNEIMERKIVELDARPSDCIALAVRQQAPIYVVRELWESLEDMSGVLEDMRKQREDLEDS